MPVWVIVGKSSVFWYRWLKSTFVALVVGFCAFGRFEAVQPPLVREAALALPDWPTGQRPVRVALLADIHLGGIDMTVPRLSRIVDRINAVRPDIVLVAGDFLTSWAAGSADIADVAAQMKRLRSRYGTVAVLGNHDNWNDTLLLRRRLEQSGVAIVDNGAVRRGPLIIAGSGDSVSGHAHLGGTLNAVRRLKQRGEGATIYLAHSPDILNWLPSGPAVLLAGHTHCGQIVLPWIGSPIQVSQIFGNKLRCGFVHMGDKRVVVTSGLSTSSLPIRVGAPPDFWILTFSSAPGASRSVLPGERRQEVAAQPAP